MRKIYFVLLGLLFAGMINAQNLQILTMEDVDVSGLELDFTGPATENFNTIIEHFKIKNVSDASIDVVVKKSYVTVVEGTFNDFCWAGTCLTSTIFQSSEMSVAAGYAQEDFDIHYHCQGIEGTTTIQYVAYDMANPNDSVYITVNYTVGESSIENLAGEVMVSDVYPNPVSAVASIDYNLKAGSDLTVTVYDMLGKKVREYDVNGHGVIQMPVSDLQAGTYFCRYIMDGELVETQKLLIK